MNLDRANFKEQYFWESSEKTLNMGKIFTAWSLPVIFLIGIIETFTYKDWSLFYCRLLYLLPAGIFLFLALLLFKQNLRYVIPAYAATLAAAMLMMSGIVLLKFKILPFSSAYKLASVTGGLVTIIFLVFVFAIGARKYLPYIIAVPLLVLLSYFGMDESIGWMELSFFINPVAAGLGAIVMSSIQEKLAFQEFEMRKLAEITQRKLESEIEERKLLQKKLEEMASQDELTGVYNRRVAFSFLEKHLHISRANQENLVVCFIDLDNLKQVNDLYGHSEGDAMIVTFTEAVKHRIRESDYICRIGGDEFIIVFPNCTISEAEHIIDRIKNKLCDEHTRDVTIDFSYGFAEYNQNDDIDIADLLEIADNNMYKNKLQKSKVG